MDTCGAKTRAGTPCKQKTIYWNGRCKFHGGLATGPSTEAGKEQCRINGRKGGRPRKAGPVEAEALIMKGDRLLSDAAISEKTEVMELVKTSVSEPFHGVVSGSGVTYEVTPGRPESSPEKPKSWMSKEAKVLSLCERCTMFASNGACLAVAKGLIPNIPTGDTCTAFSDFEKT